MLWHKNKSGEEHDQALRREHDLLNIVTPTGVQQCQVEFSWLRDCMVTGSPSVSEFTAEL